MFATMYAFYRYVKAPTVWRMITVGVSAGLALAVKHTGLLVFPMLVLLAVCEVVRQRIDARTTVETATGSVRRLVNFAIAMVAITVVRGCGVMVGLWIPLSSAREWIATKSPAD